MSNRQPISTLLGIAAAVVLAADGHAAIINVPGDQATIQAGIDAAVDGDEVVVAPGTYNEVIDFLGKAITVRSSGGAAVTVVDATGLNFVAVSCGNNVGPATVLDGFTITGGGFPGAEGGGMAINGSPTVANCVFSGNSGSTGGAIHMANGAPTVTNCQIINNPASFGGGIYSLNSSPLITGCLFNGNSAGDYGGGIHFQGGNPVVLDCRFISNSAIVSGGGLSDWSTNPGVMNCTFEGNTAGQNGGGMFTQTSSPLVVNCVFSGNTANQGGGMFNAAGGPDVVNCSFSGNIANNSIGGGMANSSPPSPTLSNCIIWGNSPSQISDINGAAATVRYSDVQGGWPGLGSNNIDADPFFTDPDGVDNVIGTEDDNLRPLPGSPCIDAGDSDAVPAGINSDLDGNPRFLDTPAVPDTGNPGAVGVVVDMGAYEHPGDPFVGDASWINPNGGLFSVPANWFPNVPGPMNTATFDLAVAYTVILDLGATNDRLRVTSGNITFDLGANLYDLASTIEPSIIVGESAVDNASLTITNGNLEGEAARIASEAGSMGAVTVTGPTATWLTNETLCIGCMGTGLLQILGGGLVINRDAIVGEEPGSFGDVLVSGAGSTWSIPFFLTIDNGIVTVTDGGTLNVGTVGFGGITVFNDGVLQGDGFINGNVANFGEMTPGASPGILTINGDYEQVGQIKVGDDSGSLLIEVAGSTPGLEHDVLDVTGTVTLGGGLFVNLIDPFDPPQGQTFSILSTPTPVTGAFDVAFMPGLTGGKFMRVEYGAGAPLTGPAGGVSVVVDNLLNLFGFGDPESVGIDGLPSGVAVGDFDNQNGIDLAITIPDADPGTAGSVLVLLNAGTDGGGNWLGFSGSTQTTVGRVPSGITVGLFDADGDLDIAVTNAGDNNVSVLLNSGFGDGTFNPPVNVAVGTAPSAIAAGDFGEDGSGDVDLAVTNEGDNTVQILTNDGGGTFDPGGGTFLAGIAPVRTRWDDIDDNKDLDLVVANQGSDDISIFLNAGGGNFGPAMNLAVGDGPVDLATADLDLNGTPDIITANNGDGTVSVILNNGDGTFVPAVHLPVGALPRSLTTIDLEGDLDFDIAVIANDDLSDPVVQVVRNDLTAGQLIFAAADELVTGTDPAFVITGDLDQDLDEDLITVNEGFGAASGAAAVGPPGPAVGSVNVSLNALMTPCPPDVNGDGVVNVLDLIDLLLCFGQPAVPACSPEDVNDDGTVNVLDLIDLLLAFGTACP